MKKLSNLGARGFLSVLGSMAAFAGAACPALYGPAPEYGMPTCTQDVECKDMGAAWYCDQSSGTGYCRHADADAGTASDKDAGK
ncbi:MAG: hypothetical protein QM765_33315 [Myxococcales bacterium]